MATATIPKSVFRKNNNIEFGYGEVPAIEINGITGWGLMGGIITFSEKEARAHACRLDTEIRKRLRNRKQLLTLL
jgi:hypothetical protein